MPNLAALAKMLAELEAKLPGIVSKTGAPESLQRLFNMQVHSPEGQALGPLMDRATVDRLNNASIVMRRKSLADLSAPRLQTVHDVQKTGAASGWKESRNRRAEREPAQFGSHPVFGSLTEDTMGPIKTGLEMFYPDRGPLLIAPGYGGRQYGKYGFVPKDKSKFTYTFGDSLDHGYGDVIANANSPAHEYAAQYDGSALGALAQNYYDAKRAKDAELGFTKYGIEMPEGMQYWTKEGTDYVNARKAQQMPDIDKWLAEYGVNGIPGIYQRHGSMARLLPRRFGEQGLPLSPAESNDLKRIDNYLGGQQSYGYYEAQGHGLTPDDIDRVIDYSVVPSLSTEKKLKKLGIGYEPIPANTPLAQLRAVFDADPARAGLSKKAAELGFTDVQKALDQGRQDMPVKVVDHYAHGGYVAR